jgi:glutaredoxin
MYVVITRDQCNFCDSAKSLLDGSSIPYTTYNINTNSSKWLLYLLKRSSITTVPQIFNDVGEHIGGYTELKEYLTKQKEE